MKADLRDVIEICANDAPGRSTFRAMYIVELGHMVYVLHAFQKRSKKGVETPKRDLDLIRQRLKEARKHNAQQGQKYRD